MSIQSQSTDGMNMRLNNLFIKIDDQAIECANSPTIPNIGFYYSLLDQVFLNVNSLFDQKTIQRINALKEAYNLVYVKIISNPEEEATPMNCIFLLSHTKKINSIIIQALQEHDYFFVLDKKTKLSQTGMEEYKDLADFIKE